MELALICAQQVIVLFLLSSNLLSLAGPMYSGYAVDAMVGKGHLECAYTPPGCRHMGLQRRLNHFISVTS